MKIEQITAINFLGLKHVDLKIASPINVFVGHNGSGKSSLRDAVKAAITGKARGLQTKNDLAQLIRRGAGKTTVSINNGEHSFSRSKGTQGAFPKYDPALDVALDSYEFVDMPPKAQVDFMEKALLTDLNKERFKGIPDQLVNIAMEKGFKSAEAEAVTKRREAKRVLGSLDVQEPQAHISLNDRAYDLSKIDASEIEKGLKKLKESQREMVLEQGRKAGALEADRGSFEEKIKSLEKEIADLQAQYATIEKMEAEASTIRDETLVRRQVVRNLKKELDASTVNDAMPQFYGPCPVDGAKCPREKDLIGAAKDQAAKIDAFQKLQTKFEEARKWAEELEEKRAAVDKEVATVRKLPGRIEAIEKEKMAIQFKLDHWQDPKEEQEMAQQISDLDSRIDAGQKLLRAYEDFQGATSRFKEAQKQKATYIKEVALYDGVAKKLGPEGILKEVLSEKIGLLNGFMAEIPLMENVHFESDLSLRVGDIPYSCLSRSERLRAGIMAQVSVCLAVGVKLLVIDEADTLDQPNRNKLVGCLFKLLKWFDTILVFSTVVHDVKPSKNPDLTFWWVENGTVQPVTEIRKAA